ncbi:MAG: type II toxin-antitoxin system RelE/ParE family toxin [Deltaproteobacteria bacterium]|nr:type II toxin-antitoxin system RelE/ParE family toxin [Deltaproteobacteria bacterium]
MKQAIFHVKAREVIKTFPDDVRKEVGKAILELQKGYNLSMPLSKPVPAVALGVEELRIKDASGIYRTFYYKKSSRGILIFHAFVKKTQKIPDHDIGLARKRLKEMLHEET